MPGYLVLAIVIGLVAALFALQNVAPVSVAFLMWRFDGSLAVVLLLTLLTGAVAALLAVRPTIVRTRWQVRRLRQRVGELERPPGTTPEPGPGTAAQPIKSASSSSAATGPR
jgi:uncharacterized integral membrane protein